MKRLAMTAAFIVALFVPSLAGEVPTGGKTEPPPPPATTQSTSTSATDSIAASVILMIVSLIR